jgi:hypothetical protein
MAKASISRWAQGSILFAFVAVTLGQVARTANPCPNGVRIRKDYRLLSPQEFKVAAEQHKRTYYFVHFVFVFLKCDSHGCAR